MKMPNFRLYSTQATTSMVVGIAAMLSVLCLAAVVFKNLDREKVESGRIVILYSGSAGFSQHRPMAVKLGTAFTVVLGAVAGIMGFSSLGQKRNERQSHSWFGLLLGAMATTIAPLLFLAWQMLAEQVI